MIESTPDCSSIEATSAGNPSGLSGSPMGPVEKSQTGIPCIREEVRSTRSFADFSHRPA